MKWLTLTFALFAFQLIVSGQATDTIQVWPEKVPGETAPKHTAVISSNNGGNTTRIAEVTNPVLVRFDPKPGIKNKGAFVVCPGGGYSILAVDKEGYEIAEWLTSIGYTAFVLQYRVPQKQAGALMDVQRAIRIIRSHAPDWQLDNDRIGVMGFSAGGSLSARVSTLYNEKTYPEQDATDTVSCKPDFAMLIYPAYLDLGENRALTPELKVDKNTPPVFIFATADDPYSNSALVMTTALRDAKVPVELHLLPKGGHGYGLRKGSLAGTTWPVLAEKWLKRTDK
ncbi:alpha/beta hydrolase [Saccharicrinis sp. FJH54]|uniref:alpha/beta hydrolase n=1 Tax=Saccharicrinis sp. FJH54 TaxID=3344665 RepID=UPI0035D40E59